MLICEFCDEEYSKDDTIDKNDEGFWCDCCDCFTYYSSIRSNIDRFTLILEDKLSNIAMPKSPTDIHLRKNLSPLRYPGGKTRMVDYLYTHIQKSKSKTLASPFTGGGSFELAMLASGSVEKLKLNDLDYGIYSLWWAVLHMPDELNYRIEHIQPTRKDYFQAQSHIQDDFKKMDMIEAAWITLLVNRLAYSGIAKANPLGGKKGKQSDLLARWNPAELIKRINYIHTLSDRITVSCEDACTFIEEAYWETDTTLFIDPPYLAKGKALYNCFFTIEDHKRLGFLLNHLYKGMPGADVLITYDYEKVIEDIYEYSQNEIIGRKYSI